MKEIGTDEHKPYRLAFAESNVGRKWERVIFADESTFSSANDGPILVYRPRGERYNSHLSVYVYLHTQCLVSFLCWGWISHEGAGMLHRIGHLDSLQYQHILQNVMLPSVRII